MIYDKQAYGLLSLLIEGYYNALMEIKIWIM